MARQRGTLLNKFFLGKEKSENYARSTLPSNRWELFWDIIKNNFGKLFLLNLLMLLFFVPLILLIVFRSGLISTYGTIYPFAQGFGVGYGAPITMAGYSENILFSVNSLVYLFLPVVAIFVALGLSGGAYVMRNIVWTEGTFVVNDFWRGIKLNFKKVLVIALLFSVVFYVMNLSIAFSNQCIAINQASGESTVLFVIIKVIAYFLMIFAGLIALHMLTLTVTYDLTIFQLIKNSILLSLALLLTNAFFIILAVLPFALFLFQGIGMFIGILFVVIIGLSYALLIWSDYCQWIYDMFINDRVKGAKKNRGIYEKGKTNDDTFEKYKNQMSLRNTSRYASTPIMPITDEELKLEELPTSFTRKDIEKLNESKQKIKEASDKYVEEHKDDEIYQVSKEQTEKQSKIDKKLEEARKELQKRDKKNKK